MATVDIFPGHRGMYSKELREGLNVTSAIGSIVDGYAMYRFIGDVAELEVVLHRFNGDRGMEDFAELLKLIEE